MTLHSNLNLTIVTQDKFGVVTLDGNVSIASGASIGLKSVSTMNIKSEAVGTMTFAGDSSAISFTGSSGTINLSGSGSTITTTQEVTANTIALTTHTHTDTEGLAANITSAPNA
jgi:hypothetical protein